MRVSWENLKGLARDWLVAIGIVVVIWLVWVRFFAPGALDSGPAPDFTLPDLAGEQVALSSHPDLVVLNFWFTTCPPCRKEIPELSAFHAEHPDIPLYGISVDRMDPSRLAGASRKLGVTYPVLHDPDGRVAGLYRVGLFPTTIVVHDGRIAAVRTGEVTKEILEDLVGDVHVH